MIEIEYKNGTARRTYIVPAAGEKKKTPLRPRRKKASFTFCSSRTFASASRSPRRGPPRARGRVRELRREHHALRDVVVFEAVVLGVERLVVLDELRLLRRRVRLKRPVVHLKIF